MTNAAKKPEAEEEPHDFLQFTISGSYYTSTREAIDFEGIVGKIPACDEENGVGSMHVRGRYAAKWIRDAVNADGSKKFPERIEKLRQVFIDDVKPVKGTLSYFGKDIKELNIDEMQELAVAKDLRYIPLPRAGMSLRDMRVNAYVAYSEKVLLKPLLKKSQEADFNFAKLPSIKLDAEYRKEETSKITNEEMIEQEQKAGSLNDDPRTRLSYADLLKIAEDKKIDVPKETKYEELYAFLFNG